MTSFQQKWTNQRKRLLKYLYLMKTHQRMVQEAGDMHPYDEIIIKNDETNYLSINYNQAKVIYKCAIKHKYNYNELNLYRDANEACLKKLKKFIIDSGKDKSLVLTPFRSNIEAMIRWLDFGKETEEEASLLLFLSFALAYSSDIYKRNVK